MSKAPAAPRTKSREDRTEDILTAALDLFARDGFEATRLDDVAVKAGISKGTIYLYFKSKEELFEAVIKRWIVPKIEKVEEISLSPDMSSEDMLREVVRLMYRDIAGTELRHILRMLIAEGQRFPHLVDFHFNTIIKRGQAVFAALMARGIERGEFRKVDIDKYPQTVMGPVMLGAIWKILLDRLQPLDLDALCEQQIDLLLHGLKADRADA